MRGKGGGDEGEEEEEEEKERRGAGDDVYALGFKDLLLQGNSDLKVFCQRDLRVFLNY